MLKTYTIYLRDGREPPQFEPALCNSDAEALSRARQLLASRPECEAADVFFGDRELFHIVSRSDA